MKPADAPLDRAVARLAASRLRLACALSHEAGAQAAAMPQGPGPGSVDAQAQAQAHARAEADDGIAAMLAQAIRRGIVQEAWATWRHALQRRPWQAVGAAALLGACWVPWLVRGMARRPDAAPMDWRSVLGSLSVWARWLDRLWPDAPQTSACRDMVVDDEPVRRTTGSHPGIFR